MSLQADRERPGISGLQNTGFEEPPDRIHFPANVEPSLGKPHVIEDGASITLPGIAEKRDDRSAALGCQTASTSQHWLMVSCFRMGCNVQLTVLGHMSVHDTQFVSSHVSGE